MRRVPLGTFVLLAACATTSAKRHEDSSARRYWPQSAPALAYPTVVIKEGGRRAVEDVAIPAEIQALFEEAEEAFGTGDCPTAEERYRELLAKSPTFYPALLGLGDCVLRRGRVREAVEHYQEAQRINPDDFLGYFSEADARLRMGNLGQARELLIQALALQPRRPTVLGVLHGISDRIGATIDDAPLAPSEVNEWWSRYASCKYPLKPWTVTDEKACLRVAAGSYREKHGEMDVEPALERFLTADAAGLTDAYVVYEVGSRVDPHIVLRLPPAERRQVERYVRCCVVVDRRR